MTQEQRGPMILPPGILAGNRGVVTAQYAVMPPDGILSSRLPGITGADIRIQTGPPMGAKFAQIFLEMEPHGGTTEVRNDGLEHFFYVLEGSVTVEIGGDSHELESDGFAYVPAGTPYQFHAGNAAANSMIWIKRPYEPIDLAAPQPLVGQRSGVPQDRPHTEGRYWQYLLPPDDLAFDMQINILGFKPGTYFPYVETHVMEHGLYMLEGQGLYFLAGDLHEAQAQDFIWMGPYCPQFFVCTGWEEAAYLLYKDVNRDVRF